MIADQAANVRSVSPAGGLVLIALMCAIPVVVAISAVALGGRRFVRSVALIIVSCFFLVGMMGLVAAHRLAGEVSATRSHGSDWQRGVEDMRNVIGSLLPLLGASFAGAVILSIGRTSGPRRK